MRDLLSFHIQRAYSARHGTSDNTLQTRTSNIKYQISNSGVMQCCKARMVMGSTPKFPTTHHHITHTTEYTPPRTQQHWTHSVRFPPFRHSMPCQHSMLSLLLFLSTLLRGITLSDLMSSRPLPCTRTHGGRCKHEQTQLLLSLWARTKLLRTYTVLGTPL